MQSHTATKLLSQDRTQLDLNFYPLPLPLPASYLDTCSSLCPLQSFLTWQPEPNSNLITSPLCSVPINSSLVLLGISLNSFSPSLTHHKLSLMQSHTLTTLNL